jgi:hypothetical protein
MPDDTEAAALCARLEAIIKEAEKPSDLFLGLIVITR